jgi:hypothetical protein
LGPESLEQSPEGSPRVDGQFDAEPFVLLRTVDVRARAHRQPELAGEGDELGLLGTGVAGIEGFQAVEAELLQALEDGPEARGIRAESEGVGEEYPAARAMEELDRRLGSDSVAPGSDRPARVTSGAPGRALEPPKGVGETPVFRFGARRVLSPRLDDARMSGIEAPREKVDLLFAEGDRRLEAGEKGDAPPRERLAKSGEALHGVVVRERRDDDSGVGQLVGQRFGPESAVARGRVPVQLDPDRGSPRAHTASPDRISASPRVIRSPGTEGGTLQRTGRGRRPAVSPASTAASPGLVLPPRAPSAET